MNESTEEGKCEACFIINEVHNRKNEDDSDSIHKYIKERLNKLKAAEKILEDRDLCVWKEDYEVNEGNAHDN